MPEIFSTLLHPQGKTCNGTIISIVSEDEGGIREPDPKISFRRNTFSFKKKGILFSLFSFGR